LLKLYKIITPNFVLFGIQVADSYRAL